jgi:glycosyltransferase involved in cell wall biosynthesis
MQTVFGYELIFMPNRARGNLTKPFSYVANSCRTLALLLRRRPALFWIQLAPVFLLYIAVAYKALRPGTRIVADCHNSMFGSRWSWLPGAMWFLNRCDFVLAHNKTVQAQALKLGVKPERLRILETRPAQIRCTPEKCDSPAGVSGDWVLMPASFSGDEPIDVVVDAARMSRGVTFVITGDAGKARAKFDPDKLPDNVRLTGFLDRGTLDSYICGATVILGLTTRPDIQLSVANEAAGAGKAMVLSDTPLLREMFPRGAVYVTTLSSQSIAAGVAEAITRRAHIEAESVALREWREARWARQADSILSSLNHRKTQQ